MYNIVPCRSKISRKSFRSLFKDVVAMNIKHMQHTTVSHDLKLITNIETEETTDPDYVSKQFCCTVYMQSCRIIPSLTSQDDSRSTGDSSVCREELLEN